MKVNENSGLSKFKGIIIYLTEDGWKYSILKELDARIIESMDVMEFIYSLQSLQLLLDAMKTIFSDL